MKRFLIVGFVFAIFIVLVSILTSIRVGGGQLPFFWSVVHEFPLIAICFVLIFRLSENTKPRHNVLVKIVAGVGMAITFLSALSPIGTYAALSENDRWPGIDWAIGHVAVNLVFFLVLALAFLPRSALSSRLEVF